MLVTPAIGDIGRSAGKMLVATVTIAYIDTLLAGLLAYGTGDKGLQSLPVADRTVALGPFSVYDMIAVDFD